MSDFQQSLLRRLNTMQTQQTSTTPDRWKQPGPPVRTGQKTHSSSSGNSLVDELHLRRKAILNRTGTSGEQSHDIHRHENSGGRKTEQSPPPAPKKKALKRPPKPMPGKCNEQEPRGGDTASNGTGNTRKKVSELASKLAERAPVVANTPDSVLARPKLKPAKLVNQPDAGRPQKEGFSAKEEEEEISYMNFRRFPREAQPQQIADVVSTSDNTVANNEITPQLPQKSDSARERPQVTDGSPLPIRRGGANVINEAPPVNQRISSQSTHKQENRPLPDEQTPPVVPKRSRSFRSLRNVNVGEAKDLANGGTGTAFSSGSNSGTSGDGLVVHPMSRRSVQSTADSIAPMGSSSESECSGDGRVQR